MLRQTPFFTALEPQIVSSGLQQDLHPLLRLLWDKAQNVTFFSGRVKDRPLPIEMYDSGAATVRGLSQQQAQNGTRWVWASSGGLVTRWYGPGVEEIITLDCTIDETVNDPATYIDFTHYGDWTIINSSEGPAYLYKPGSAAAAFGNAPTDVQKFMKKLSFVMALGYGDRGTRVGWSDSQNIEEWNPAAGNLAGALSIDDFDTPIVSAHRLGQSISVFSEDQMALVSYIADPYYFGQKVVLDGIGSVSKNGVTGDGKGNYGVGRNGVWWTDSNSYRYIDEGYLHDYLQDNVNWAQKSKIQAVRNDYTGCIEFFFPMVGSTIINEGWSWDPRTGGWSPIPPVAMKDERKLFNRPLVGLEDGTINQDMATRSPTRPLVLETKPLLMQLQSQAGLTDVHNSCRVDEVVLLLKRAKYLEFRVGSAEAQEEDFSWSPWMAIDPLSKTYLLPHMPDGVYWKLEFRNTLEEWELDFQGFMLFGSLEGTKRSQQ